ncbi:MAG: stage V sporulation protein AB [Lachnospiraceae bacterium]|nr:stage V sporulation protein AB [Lachnospiraceae bacterium]
MLTNTIAFSLFCLTAGGATAAGYVAFITLLGVFDKLAEKYKALNKRALIELLIILGVTLGNAVEIFRIPISLGIPSLIAFNLLGGIFTGCLAGALAETLAIFPILSRRFSIRKHLPYILFAVALGKAVGSFIQFFYLP